MLLDDRRYIAYQHTAHRSEQCTIRRIPLALFAHSREDMSAEDTAPMLHKVPRPDMAHLAIHILQVLMRHGNPFWFGRRTRCSGVHVRLAGEQHILLAVLMALYVRTQGLKRIVHGHVHAI